MRLINTTTHELETFNDERQLPPFAILSHRWVHGQEVLYKDIVKRRNPQLEGWKKIRLCCSQALQDDLRYAWVDTCCIDKDSSAELSEAINSMFRWYRSSRVCYAYLLDVKKDADTAWEESFVTSSWFTRSWTLQELLAPSKLIFYDCTWTELGPKATLCEEIAEASGIHLSAITTESLDLSAWSVSQRMSWASKRNATRVEDIAYSLLGIFDVNIPLLYGEGNRAFRRLQEEIIRQSHDHTIFAWSGESRQFGILAPSPAEFQNARDFVVQEFYPTKSYALTNIGLSIELPVEEWLPGKYWAGLNCSNNRYDQCGIWLVQDQARPSVFNRVGISSSIRSIYRHKWMTCIEPQDLTIRDPRHGLCTLRPLILCVSNLKPPTILEMHQAALPGFSMTVSFSIGVGAKEQLASFAVKGSKDWYGLNFSSHRPRYTAAYHRFRCIASYNPTFPYSTRTFYMAIGVATPLLPSIAQGVHSLAGNALLFDFSNWTTTLLACKIGFDSSFNPICFLAEKCHIPARKAPTDVDMLRPRGDSLLNKDLTSKNFWQCTGYEDLGWQSPSPEIKLPSKDMQKGLWAFKGKRGETCEFRLHPETQPNSTLIIRLQKAYGEIYQLFIYDDWLQPHSRYRNHVVFDPGEETTTNVP